MELDRETNRQTDRQMNRQLSTKKQWEINDYTITQRQQQRVRDRHKTEFRQNPAEPDRHQAARPMKTLVSAPLNWFPTCYSHLPPLTETGIRSTFHSQKTTKRPQKDHGKWWFPWTVRGRWCAKDDSRTAFWPSCSKVVLTIFITLRNCSFYENRCSVFLDHSRKQNTFTWKTRLEETDKWW